MFSHSLPQCWAQQRSVPAMRAYTPTCITVSRSLLISLQLQLWTDRTVRMPTVDTTLLVPAFPPLFPREERILAKLQLWQQEKARQGRVSWQLLRRAAGSRAHEEHGVRSAAFRRLHRMGSRAHSDSVLDPYWQKTDSLFQKVFFLTMCNKIYIFGCIPGTPQAPVQTGLL